MDSNARRPSFLSGVSVLTLSALVVKVIGLVYRIPLLRYLGTEGMGYFNTAYELYALLCVLSTAGLPVAMSLLIAGYEAAGRPGEARRVFSVALLFLTGIGLAGTLLLYTLALPLAEWLGNPGAAPSVRAIAPTVFLICLSAAARGYFQGFSNMTPTALSQVIEAGGKLLLGLLFAARAVVAGASLPIVSAWAVMGLTVGTGVSALYLLLHRTLHARAVAQKRLPAPPIAAERRVPADLPDPTAPLPARAILRALAATAIPVTVGAGVISLTKCIDLAMILHRLQAVGYTVAEANALYGCYSTLTVPIFNILPSLTASVALSAAPALTAARERGARGEGEARRVATTSVSLILAVSIPAALGLAVFAKDILALLFGSQPTAVAEATPWLSLLGLSVPAACLVTLTGSMLQAAGKPAYPIRAMLCGVAAKTALCYVLLGLPGWGLLGAPLSSLVCDTVIVAVNLGGIARHAPAMLPLPRVCAALFAAPTLLSILAVGLVRLWRDLIGATAPTPLAAVGTVLAVVCLYGGGLLLFLLPARRRTAHQHTVTDK